MQKISPFLWFNTQAEDAAKFYASVFTNSQIDRLSYYSEAFPGRAGTVMTVNFKLFGQDFIALNGGPAFSFTPAISLFIHCDTQAEVDDLWTKLTEGGEPGQCGWLKDKFGISWQVVPKELFELLANKDPEKAKRVTQSLMTMSKIDVNVLQRAADET